MRDRDHLVGEAIRRAFPDLEPSDEEKQMAKDRLLAAVEAEKAQKIRRRRWPWIAAVAVVAGVFFGLQVAGIAGA